MVQKKTKPNAIYANGSKRDTVISTFGTFPFIGLFFVSYFFTLRLVYSVCVAHYSCTAPMSTFPSSNASPTNSAAPPRDEDDGPPPPASAATAIKRMRSRQSAFHNSAENSSSAKRRRNQSGEKAPWYVMHIGQGAPWADEDGNAYAYDLRVRNGSETMTLHLGSVASLPHGVENQCPISCDAFDQTTVDGLDGAHFCPVRQELCIGTLPCGHSFHMVSLLMHFTMSDMRCPTCRCGFSKKLRQTCIPKHLRRKMAAIALASQRKEQEELLREDEALARQGQLEADNDSMLWEGAATLPFQVPVPVNHNNLLIINSILERLWQNSHTGGEVWETPHRGGEVRENAHAGGEVRENPHAGEEEDDGDESMIPHPPMPRNAMLVEQRFDNYASPAANHLRPSHSRSHQRVVERVATLQASPRIMQDLTHISTLLMPMHIHVAEPGSEFFLS